VPITTCLWFDGNADEAVDFYLSVFPGSKRGASVDATDDMPHDKGSTVAVDFELLGSQFMALNGGPEFTFSSATSFMIPCADQAEVDHYWDQLTKGGTEIQCGWCTDRFGVTWQVVPTRLQELLSDPDEGRAYRAMQAMMQMVKFDIAGLEAAADGP
jgi:predicted 3-demethylubiquinone-9 3-methyltransferase (glyoxalase superfamily)